MRELVDMEVQSISGGEATCTVGIPSGVSCTGTLRELGQLALQAHAFMAMSPITVSGIYHRMFLK